jgi:hypothetical protein
MNRAGRATFYGLVFCICAGGYVSANGRTLPETANYLPPETFVVVNINDFGQLRAQFEKTNLYRLWKDPSMAPFVKDLTSKLQNEVRQWEPTLADTIFESKVLPEGRVTAAWVLSERVRKGDFPPFVFLGQWGQSVEKVKAAVDKLVQKAVEQGFGRKTEDYRGVSIVTLLKNKPPRQVPDFGSNNPENDSEPPMKTVEQPPQQVNFCFVDDCLVGSEDAEVLKFVLAHLQGASSGSLSGDGDYTNTMKAIGPDHDIEFYVNIRQIVKSLVAEDNSGRAAGIVNNLGVDNVTGFGMAAGVSRQAGSMINIKALLAISGAKKGIFKMIECETAPSNVPAFVSDSASEVAVINLDIKKAFAEMVKIMTAFSPQAAAIMYMPLIPPSPDGAPGIELKRDIIDHLGSQVVVSTSINKPIQPGLMPSEVCAAFAVSNRQAIEKSLSNLHSNFFAAGKTNMRRELLGHAIYRLEMPKITPFFMGGPRQPMQGPGAIEGPKGPMVAFTVTDSHLIFGTETTVEKAIRRLVEAKSASINSARWFNRAKSALPGAVGIMGLQNTAEAMDVLWKSLKAGANTQSGSDATTGINPNDLLPEQMGKDLFNSALLPDYDVIRKYFGVSAYYGISRPDGYFFEIKHLNPLETP